MAKKIEISDDQTYQVTLTKAIKVGRTTLTGRCRLRGDVLRSLLQSDSAAVANHEPLGLK